MTAPLDRLSEIRAYAEAARQGSWETTGAWAEFIARARTDLPLLLALAEADAMPTDSLYERERRAGALAKARAALAALSEQA